MSGRGSRRAKRWTPTCAAATALIACTAFVLAAGCRGRGDQAPEAVAEEPAAAAEESATPTDHEIVLYFPGTGDELLHGEKRTVLPIAAPEDRAKQCLEELIRGPKPPLLAALPDGVHVRQIYLLADGTAFVDFSGELLAHRGGSLGELQTVYAVVDTLVANVPEIRRVGLLVDGRPRETLAGHVDIRTPLPADYQYVDPAARPSGAVAGTGGAGAPAPDAAGTAATAATAAGEGSAAGHGSGDAGGTGARGPSDSGRRTAVIGVFDSGIGGLTVFKEIARRFPALDVLYLGDTARVPYGTKSPETVVRYSFEAAHFLGKHGIELLVVACNTSSALALDALERDLAIPVIGVIRPGARRAAGVTRSGRIGVIGTPATIKSGAYARALEAAAPKPSLTVISATCPLFVPLAEEGWTDNAVAHETARVYLEPLARERIDTLVLGCTHYPLLSDVIGQVMGADVTLVDSAVPVADEVGARLRAQGRDPSSGGGTRRFFVTDSWERFLEVGARFLGHPIDRPEQVSIVGE